MPYFEIVAHRGVPTEAPENTIPSFERAIDLGADAVELDVRLTRDRVPVVYHYFYLDEATPLSGPIFDYTYDQLRDVEVLGTGGNSIKGCRISTLGEILETLGGRIDLEIEIKGPEPESSGIIGSILLDYKHLWPSIGITSYEPALLLDIKQLCSGLPTDLLFPRSEEWMGLDVVAYASAHRARLAGARAVHLHPSQLSPEVVSTVRSHGVDIHAWDVNDEESLNRIVKLGIPKICTDELQRALDFRRLI
ncbi:MAG: glycerophosphodiester phosphodiesterase [Anaerolineae bacterium]|nr:glycerophosphodiester phosphodiesterase [Anaerolineae bacterium]